MTQLEFSAPIAIAAGRPDTTVKMLEIKYVGKHISGAW